MVRIEEVIEQYPTGVGKNFTIIHSDDTHEIVKARMACSSLKKNSMRLIYAYNKKEIIFIHIELYFKGEKANEDRERIKRFLKIFETAA